ncbi:MAG TPA: 4Fe-4S dicluster domain-containing protein [Gaiellaceae bacterium]|nr:4Fe-4S dicluster domain-containing protein [Gaiellaceae bacterium]
MVAGARTGEVAARVMGPEGLGALVEALLERGYRVVGPTVRDGAIVLDELSSADELPQGWTASQEAATYRLERRSDDAVFGWAVGPHSWKQEFLPPRTRLWRASSTDGGVPEIEEPAPPDRPLALLGARSCDLHAIAIQDRVLLEGRYVERDYAQRREDAFVVAVNCGVPGGTCFCASMGTGPRAGKGFDLALTEVLEGEHRFVVEAGSERGAELLEALPTRPATDDDLAASHAVTDDAAARMGRRLDTTDLLGLLARNREHPRWAGVADRCLTCGNCTLVCPTCFCTSIEDVNDLADGSAERWRVWDVCFSIDYSYLHGGSVRRSPRARYRQWLMHKFGTWHDQFGTSGCVGCGRCITWCPVGIDVTEELAAIRAADGEVDRGIAR